MIQSDRASLSVQSTLTTPAEISGLLALEPTDVTEMGTASRSGRVREHHTWTIHVDTLGNTDVDQTGTRALRTLLEKCIPARGRIDSLPSDCDTVIWWYGDSDSTQGGFVLAADLVQMISALGVDLMGSVWLPDEDSTTTST